MANFFCLLPDISLFQKVYDSDYMRQSVLQLEPFYLTFLPKLVARKQVKENGGRLLEGLNSQLEKSFVDK